jgi:hypothetical protein
MHSRTVGRTIARGIAAGVAVLSLAASQAVSAQAAPAADSPVARLSAAIEKSGQSWQKPQGNVWVQVRDGKNIPRIGLFATSAEDVVVVGATVADAKSMRLDAAAARRLLTAAGNYYKVKVTLIENGNLVIRVDTAARLIDGPELAAQADLVARAADELNGSLKRAKK